MMNSTSTPMIFTALAGCISKEFVSLSSEYRRENTQNRDKVAHRACLVSQSEEEKSGWNSPADPGAILLSSPRQSPSRKHQGRESSGQWALITIRFPIDAAKLQADSRRLSRMGSQSAP